tara:strand:+ start:196 stop:498 length:303 start_codon:yes stop_codon:yes gene_type:complete
MEYTEELLLRLDGLGITMSSGPVDTLRQLDELYESTRYNTFGYLEDLEKFDRIFEPVYGLEFFILVKNVRKQFKRELEFYDLAVDLKQIHEQSKEKKHEY